MIFKFEHMGISFDFRKNTYCGMDCYNKAEIVNAIQSFFDAVFNDWKTNHDDVDALRSTAIRLEYSREDRIYLAIFINGHNHVRNINAYLDDKQMSKDGLIKLMEEQQ